MMSSRRLIGSKIWNAFKKDRVDNMSPPLPVTEDTPPDMLAGAMDLHVVLPNGRDIKMSVERSTPMMDLLVHVTTSNKISPGGHIIHVIGDRGVLPYKPSTPIGALDTWTIHIVPKKQVGNVAVKKKLPITVSNNSTPFEQTFRLQVHLPRNQLYVTRIGFQTVLGDVLKEVCNEKGLDVSKYCLTHPDKLEETLDLEKTFYDYKLQHVSLVNRNNKPIGLSNTDIMALKYGQENNKSRNNKYTSHLCEGSISSGSLEGRSLSPTHSEESSSSPTIPKPKAPIPRPYRKRRPAPKPPQASINAACNRRDGEAVVISHSRNSSDSSGYHESSVLSESPETNSLPDPLKRHSKLPSAVSSTDLHTCVVSNVSSVGSHKINNNLSRSLSNLATIVESSSNSGSSSRFESDTIKNNAYSASSTSLASLGARKKKPPAPPPPVMRPCSMLSLKEEDDSVIQPPATNTAASASTCKITKQKSVAPRLSPTIPTMSADNEQIDNNNNNKTRSAPSTPLEPPSPFGTCSNSHSSSSNDNNSVNYPIDRVVVLKSNYPTSPASPAPPAAGTGETNSTIIIGATADDLIMDDEEIDRIFHDATKDYETPSLCCSLPSAASSSNAVIAVGTNERSDSDWRYKLPAPPSAFRDDDDDADDNDAAYRLTPPTKMIEDDVAASGKNHSTGKKPNFKTNLAINSDRTTANTLKSSKNDSPTSPIDENTVDDNVTCRNRLLLIKTTTTTSINTNNGGGGGNDLTSITTNDSGLGSDDSSLPSTSDGSRHVDERPPADSHYTKIRVPSTAATSSATAEVVSTNINKNNNSSSSSSKSIQRRSSVLQNFTISSYRSSKPTEIFHDESVKTSKTTQLAINNHPSARISSLLKNTLTDDEANKSNNNLIARHSSFSNNDKSRDYKSITPTVKRSKSTISLLSGNYAKFNRLIKKQTDNLCREGDGRRNSSIGFSSTDDNTAEGGTVVTEELDDGRSIVETSSLKKYSSEISVDKVNQDEKELLELQDEVLRLKQRVLMKESILSKDNENVPELQSLQVLRGILPQINKTRPPATSTDDIDHRNSNAIIDNSSSNANKPAAARKDISTADSHFTEPPSINLKSWNERPKRQVSIKLDNDYVYGDRRKDLISSTDNDISDKNHHNQQQQQSKLKSIIRERQKVIEAETAEGVRDPSRVPIVRAVEFKKPFVQKINFPASNNNNNENNNHHQSRHHYQYREVNSSNNNNNNNNVSIAVERDRVQNNNTKSIPSYLFGSDRYRNDCPLQQITLKNRQQNYDDEQASIRVQRGFIVEDQLNSRHSRIDHSSSDDTTTVKYNEDNINNRNNSINKNGGKTKLKNVKFANCPTYSSSSSTKNEDDDYDDNIGNSNRISRIEKSNSFLRNNNNNNSSRNEIYSYNKHCNNNNNINNNNNNNNKSNSNPQFEIYRDQIDSLMTNGKNRNNNNRNIIHGSINNNNNNNANKGIFINNSNNNNSADKNNYERTQKKSCYYVPSPPVSSYSSSSKYSLQKMKFPATATEDVRDDLLQSIRGFDRDRLRRIRVK